MTQTLNDLALLSIGAGLGLVLALIAVMTYGLYTANVQSRNSTKEAHKTIADWLQKNYAENTRLRQEVVSALSRLDGEALRASSLAIQRSAKTLGAQVDQLQKVVYAQPPSPALDFTASGLDEEAEEDARMLAERNRWQAGQNQAGNPYQPTSQPANQFDADPLAGLTEEEKRQRTLEYFEKRRAARAGFPYMTTSIDYPAPSAPPTAGSGIYASLLEEAASRPPAPSPAPDFSGLETDSEVDLVGKGELE